MTAGRVRLWVDVACRGGSLSVLYDAVEDRDEVWQVMVRGLVVELDGQGMGRLVESMGNGVGRTEVDRSGQSGRALEVVLRDGVWVWMTRWGWQAESARVEASEAERLVAIVMPWLPAGPWLPLVAPL